MRARTVVFAIVPLLFAAVSAAAQTYAGDCLVSPNSRGGTYISCRRGDASAREARRIASDARREALARNAEMRAEARARNAEARATARADSRARQRRLTDERLDRVRERVITRELSRPPRVYYRRW